MYANTLTNTIHTMRDSMCRKTMRTHIHTYTHAHTLMIKTQDET